MKRLISGKQMQQLRQIVEARDLAASLQLAKSQRDLSSINGQIEEMAKVRFDAQDAKTFAKFDLWLKWRQQELSRLEADRQALVRKLHMQAKVAGKTAAEKETVLQLGKRIKRHEKSLREKRQSYIS